jgi:hypothetical protein
MPQPLVASAADAKRRWQRMARVKAGINSHLWSFEDVIARIDAVAAEIVLRGPSRNGPPECP